jgi:hypothetical protein
MKFRIDLQISGKWTLVLESGAHVTDWMLREALEKGWYRIEWNGMKIIETRTNKQIGKVLMSKPAVIVKEVAVEERPPLPPDPEIQDGLD